MGGCEVSLMAALVSPLVLCADLGFTDVLFIFGCCGFKCRSLLEGGRWGRKGGGGVTRATQTRICAAAAAAAALLLL